MCRRTITGFCLVLLAVVRIDAQSDSHSRGGWLVHIIDGETGAPVTHAMVQVDDAWVLPDSAGVVALEAAAGSLPCHIAALGYRTSALLLPSPGPVTVRLQPEALRVSDEVLVTGQAVPDEISIHSDRHRQSTTGALAQVAGIDMVSRGHFGHEPSLRGMQGARVGVLIDGMHMIPACVDRMDPVTAYVEVGNLERLEVTKGGFDLTRAQSLAGSIDLITRKAEFSRPRGVFLQSGYETGSALQSWSAGLNTAGPYTAMRATGALQRGGAVHAGGKQTLSGTGFSKVNAKLDVSRRLGPKQRLDVGVLGDRAWDAGYPALLMDTRKAQSLLVSATHTYTEAAPGTGLKSLRSRIYHSRVDHWMDDDDRDVGQRQVMTDMHMPMYGNTRTWGWRQELEAATTTRDLRLVVDAYRLAAFADMKMLSTQPDVTPMYLLNLGDVRSNHIALAADVHQRLPGGFSLRLDTRLDGVDSKLADELGRRQVASRFSAADLSRRDLAASYGVVAAWEAAPRTQLRLGLAHSSRQPSHTEAYGFFLYDAGDGAFYHGNPRLVTEHGDQVELGLDHRGDRLGLAASVYVQRVSQYIAGVLDEPGFKTFQNLSEAELAGLEVDAALRPTRTIELTVGGTWTYGQNQALDEPLPMISPLKGTAKLTWTRADGWLQVGSRLAARQNRIARRTTWEDVTPGYAVVDVRGAWEVERHVRLQLGVENVFDRAYNEHLSVGNLPARGRSFYLTVGYDR